MHQIPIHQIMQSQVITTRPDALTADAAQRMQEHNIRRLLVVDEENCLVGIVTDTDALEAETAGSVLHSYEPDIEAQWLTVADIMATEVVTIAPDATVGQLAMLLMKHKVSGLPVVVEDANACNRQSLVGVVTETDIFRLLADAWEKDKVNVTIQPSTN